MLARGAVSTPPACSPLPTASAASTLRLKMISSKKDERYILDPPALSGTIAESERAVIAGSACTDSPDQRGATTGQGSRDGVSVRIAGAKDGGKSRRGWTGMQCDYELRADDGSGAPVILDASVSPPFNELTAVLRDGSAAVVALQFNGYASEFPKGGNRLVGVDLCEGKVRWVSKDLVSNGPVMRVGDAIISTYGFTDEPDFVYVHDANSGARLQRLPIPSAGQKMAFDGDRLTVSTYDAVSVFEVKRD